MRGKEGALCLSLVAPGCGGLLLIAHQVASTQTRTSTRPPPPPTLSPCPYRALGRFSYRFGRQNSSTNRLLCATPLPIWYHKKQQIQRAGEQYDKRHALQNSAGSYGGSPLRQGRWRGRRHRKPAQRTGSPGPRGIHLSTALRGY